MTEAAALVVGADGRHSLVARTTGAAADHQTPPLTMAYYTYWDGVPVNGGEMYARARRAVGAWPTNDGLVMTYVAWPVEEFPTFRADVEGSFLATLDLAGDSASGRAPAAAPSASAAAPTCPAASAPRTAPAGRWWATPAWSWTPSPARGSATPSATPSC